LVSCHLKSEIFCARTLCQIAHNRDARSNWPPGKVPGGIGIGLVSVQRGLCRYRNVPNASYRFRYRFPLGPQLINIKLYRLANPLLGFLKGLTHGKAAGQIRR